MLCVTIFNTLRFGVVQKFFFWKKVVDDGNTLVLSWKQEKKSKYTLTQDPCNFTDWLNFKI